MNDLIIKLNGMYYDIIEFGILPQDCGPSPKNQIPSPEKEQKK